MVAQAAASAAPVAGATATHLGHAVIYWLWALFWGFMTIVEVQEHLYDRYVSWWEPLLWQVTSALPATLWLIAQQRYRGYARYLPQPSRWLAHHAKWLPLIA